VLKAELERAAALLSALVRPPLPPDAPPPKAAWASLFSELLAPLPFFAAYRGYVAVRLAADDATRRSWVDEPPTLPEGTAPFARLVPPRAQAAPTHPGARRGPKSPPQAAPKLRILRLPPPAASCSTGTASSSPASASSCCCSSASSAWPPSTRTPLPWACRPRARPRPSRRRTRSSNPHPHPSPIASPGPPPACCPPPPRRSRCLNP
jgi:hypothetical protein